MAEASRFALRSATLLAVVTALAICMVAGAAAYAQQVPLPGTSIPKYVDPLPRFPVRVDGTQPLQISMNEFQQYVLPASLYAALPAPFSNGTYVWSYQMTELGRRGTAYPQTYPGWTVGAMRGTPTQVTYINNLVSPFLEFYPAGATPVWIVDQTLNWADPLNQGVQFTPYTGPVPACVHLHGGEVPSAFDGGPDAWFTPNGPGYVPITGPGYVTNTYTYPNSQEAATIWFHDHGIGVTRLNPHMGMAAFYIISDPANEPTNLPGSAYDQEIVIQDRLFDTNGQLMFPAAGINPTVHPYWMPEFFGDTILVNGKSWPYWDVEPRRYRMRFLNGSNARVYVLSFSDPKVDMWQIATDDGYLDAPAPLKTLVIAPGERAEVIVDFDRVKKTNVTLLNTGRSPHPAGAPTDPRTDGQIMQFRVNQPLSGPDHSCDPALGACALRPNNPIVRLNPLPADVPTRQLTLNEEIGPGGPLEMLLNNSKLGYLGTAGAVSESPRVGSTEIWDIINLTADTHPIHTHLVSFQILSRQPFQAGKYIKAYDASFPGGYNPGDGLTYLPGVFMPGYGPPLAYGNCVPGAICGGNPDPTPYVLGAPVPPAANEAGWKDTVASAPGEITRIAVRWAPTDAALADAQPGVNLFHFDPSAGLGVLDDGFGYPGGPGYVWHCHIIDHEDNEMMRRYEVSP